MNRCRTASRRGGAVVAAHHAPPRVGRAPLVGLPVFALLLVVEHGEVGLVAALGYVVVLHGLADGAPRLVGMRAVVETAVLGEVEDLAEIARQLLAPDVEGAEALDARCVDEVAAAGQREHLAESGGVHARVVGLGDVGRAQVDPGQDGVDERRFAHAAVAAEERRLTLQQGQQTRHVVGIMGGELHDGVADVLVEEAHGRLVAPLVLGEEVELVEGQDHGHAIGLRASQETVDEGGACLRVVDRDDKQGLIDVGGEDVALFAEVGGSADDVVAPVADGGDEGRSLGIEADLHPVAHGHGIGAANALQAKVALDLAVHHPAVVGLDAIPAPRVFND